MLEIEGDCCYYLIVEKLITEAAYVKRRGGTID